MKKIIKIICSNYYSLISNEMIKIARKELSKYDCKIIEVPGCFEIPYMIAKSLKEDKSENLNNIYSWKGKKKNEIRNNIIKITKLNQLNLDNQNIYSGYLALGCIIKGKTINHEVISLSIFSNIQKLSIKNIIPIGNGIFNANNLKEAKLKLNDCTKQACKVLNNFIDEKKN